MSHILIVEARFYEDIADQLKDGAIQAVKDAGATYDVLNVPGSFEIPAAIKFAIDSGKYDGYVALGCVIRGETTHYDYVCGESARGLNDLAITHNAPIGYGILTCESKEQALLRADSDGKNMGGKAAKACLRMLEIKEHLGIAHILSKSVDVA